ncbi:MAG: enoyl-CoA hydratase/isomerase family protein [Chloroflexi bacterium]|nr:enoyl-CoA hydratase/isomerase family protein [Chloroflexota bacterium]
MATYKTLLYEPTDGGSRVTLNQPERRNPFGFDTARELTAVLREASADKSVRAVTITGAGTAFSAGGDLDYMSKLMGQPSHVLANECLAYTDLFRLMREMDLPIVAAVNGPALAGATGLVCACDMAIASDKASFGTVEITVGLFPMLIMPVVFRAVGRRHALDMGLTGRIVPPQEAKEMGIVNKVVPHEKLSEEVDALVKQLKSRSRVPLSWGKKALNFFEDMDIDRALAMAREINATLLPTQDAREGMTAFLEKRKPVWKDA